MSLTKKQYDDAQQRALELFYKASIILTNQEKANLEVADFGLNKLNEMGLEIITYVNTERCCAKEMVLFSKQICPEHCHPSIDGNPGKEETFRCRYGEVYLYVEGAPTSKIKAILPQGHEKWFTVFHELILHPGEQYTLSPNTLHWFQAGPNGAVVSEFSTKSRDESDIFTDLGIKRIPEIQ
ncbi:MAG TPA: D-lyxose/D-mannose family sugar isomerase [Firmicutes bacterium]|jgi:D-lyxose ketol-isomerase|nr:D-lyxose/D-mannose family sugar isomerase [Bacillota bacterium]